MTWTADRRLVISHAGDRVLEPDEPQTGRLLANEGGEVSDADCKRYGLGKYADEGAVEPEPEPAQGKPITPIVKPENRRGGRRR